MWNLQALSPARVSVDVLDTSGKTPQLCQETCNCYKVMKSSFLNHLSSPADGALPVLPRAPAKGSTCASPGEHWDGHWMPQRISEEVSQGNAGLPRRRVRNRVLSLATEAPGSSPGPFPRGLGGLGEAPPSARR